MNTLVCSCLKCHGWIGKFENLWDRIGKTYYSPICPKSQDLGGLVRTGEVRDAPANSGVIENSFLQDLVCKGCGANMGFRCDNAPASHTLIKDQLVLRIGGMSIVTEDTGEKAFLRVRRKFSLTGAQSPSVNGQEGRERPISLIGNGAEVEDQQGESEINTAIPINDDDPLPGLIRFAEWAKDAIAGQKKDVGRISYVFSKMEKDMKSFTKFMAETQRDLATVPNVRPWESMQRSVTFLEEEVSSIRTELENRPDLGCSNEDDGVKLSVEELDVLTSSITKISQKVNEVESLKMELQFMKTRLKRFEDASRTFKQAAEPQVKESSPAVPAVPNSSTPRIHRVVSEGGSGANYRRTLKSDTLPRKRKSDEFETNPVSENMVLAVSSSQNKRVSLEQVPNAYWKIRHQSRLSNVQFLDDVPDPEDGAVNAEKFIDGHYSESDRRHISDHIRNYESAPESQPARRRAFPIRDQTTARNSSSPEEISPPPSESARRPKFSRLHTLQKQATFPSRRRRTQSEALRNEDGVRLTKKGEPDRRSMKGRNLKLLHERMKVQREQVVKDETGQRQMQGAGRREGEGEEQAEGEDQGENRGEVGDSGEGMDGRTDVLPSVEGGAPIALMITHDVENKEEASKRAGLEARDRLVRETLEREFGEI